MPLIYSVFPAEEHIRIIGKGKITANDCITTVRRVAADPLVQTHFSVLADVRMIVLADPGKVVDVAEELEDLLPRWEGNVAIVARGAMLFSAVLLATHVRAAQPINIKVFGDCASAESFCIKGRLSSLLMTQEEEKP